MRPAIISLLVFIGFNGAVAQTSSLVNDDRLQVSEARLLYRGRPIMLRGVAAGDPILARENRPLSDYARIAGEWNANVVRLDVHPTLWRNRNHGEVLNVLEKNVQAALKAGLFVIIDWHAIGWPDGYFEKPEPQWQDPDDLYDSTLVLAEDFWEQVARRFGQDGRIIFELWNEAVDDAEVKDRAPESPQWAKLKPHWQKLSAIVRRHSRNLLLVSSSQWAYDLRGIRQDLLDDPNAAYTWHVYAGQDDNSPALWAKHLDQLQLVRPVLVTEWGFDPKTREHFRGTAKGFGQPFVEKFLEERNLHSTAWCWHDDWTPAMLKKDWKTPTVFGQFVKDYLAGRQSDRP